MLEKFNVTIVGLGLVGGSYAKALKALKPKHIWAVDIDEKTLQKGVEMKLIDKGYTDAKIPLELSDLVIISLYPSLVEEFINGNIKNFKTGAIITDVTGIKNGIVDVITKIVPDDMDFVFGHPMAGKEKKGLDYSSAEVLQDANYIITPTEKNKEKSIQIIEWMARNIGFKNIIKLDPQKHDEVIAFTSQLPHAIAVALVNSDDLNLDTGTVVGDSYRELTRIAQINGELWSELFMGNKDNLVQKIEVFQRNLEILKTAIVNQEKQVLEEEFKKASNRRENL